MPETETIMDISTTAPPTLDHVIGQKQAVELLRVALAAFWADHAAGTRPTFGPVLLAGPAGVGKTLFAQIIARELGGSLRETLGQTLCMGGDDLNEILLEATDDSILFVDEAHLASAYVQTTFLRALEERKLIVPKSPWSGKCTTIPLERFTALFATTNPEGLIAPLRDRMKLILHFDFYRKADLARMCRQRARALRWEIEPQVCVAIARCAKATPRLALRLLESCRRTSRAGGDDLITMRHFMRTVELEGLEGRLGLDRVEQRYMTVLAEAQGTMRVGALAATLGVAMPTVSAVIERFLVREGLVVRTEAGRELTPKGWQFVRNELVDRE